MKSKVSQLSACRYIQNCCTWIAMSSPHSLPYQVLHSKQRLNQNYVSKLTFLALKRVLIYQNYGTKTLTDRTNFCIIIFASALLHNIAIICKQPMLVIQPLIYYSYAIEEFRHLAVE